MDKSTFPQENVAANVPLFALALPVPVDKAPPLVTWSKFAPSIWSSWENEREPMEVKPMVHNGLQSGDHLSKFSIAVVRGYSRSTVLAYGIAQTLMVEDLATLSDAEKEEFTRPLQSVKFH